MVVAALNASCADAKIPVWNGTLYGGDSARGGLRRGGVNPAFIACSDHRFDDVVCMSSADFKSWNETYIGGCKEWKRRPGSIMVKPRVLGQLIAGERTLADLHPDEYYIVPEEVPAQ
jgi:hypothetical protein